jgi:hypothetical protein
MRRLVSGRRKLGGRYRLGNSAKSRVVHEEKVVDLGNLSPQLAVSGSRIVETQPSTVTYSLISFNLALAYEFVN